MIILRAQSPTPTPPELAKVAYLRSALSDVLHFYSVLTNRKIWIELGVNVKNVTVNSPKQMPREEVLALIRGTLLNDYGIEIRDLEQGSGSAEASSSLSNPQAKGNRSSSTLAEAIWRIVS